MTRCASPSFAILDNRWESALLRYRAAPVAGWTAGAPPWDDGGVILLRPDNLEEKAGPFARAALAALPPERNRDELSLLVDRLSDRLSNRLGWMPRTHALRLPIPTRARASRSSRCGTARGSWS
jgi:hypothetical protein